jgi:PAS domain S-box-containing protein
MNEKILLVEDDVLTSVTTAKLLEKKGYRTVARCTSAEALEAVTTDPEIALVLMDINLETEMEGLKTAETIQSMKDVPVIFHSNHADEEKLNEARNVPNYGYILKNSGAFILIETIAMALHHFQAKKEQEYARRQIQYQADLLQQVSEAIIATDTELRIRSWNRAAEHIYGWQAEAVMGKDLDVLLHSEFLGITKAEAQQVFQKSGLWRGEVKQRRRNGETVYVEAAVSIVRDLKGNFAGGVTVNRDITERKKMEEGLRYERDLNRNIMETSPAAIIVFDTFGGIRFANRQAREVLGVMEDGTCFSCIDPAWEVTDFSGTSLSDGERPVAEVLRTGKPVYRREHAVLPPGGEKIYLTVNAVPISDEGGETDGVVAIFTDITDEYKLRRQLELQRDTLLHISRLTKLEEIAGTFMDYAVSIKSVECAALFLEEDTGTGRRLIACRGGESSWFRGIEKLRESHPFIRELCGNTDTRFGTFPDFFHPGEYKIPVKAFRAAAIIPLVREGRLLGTLLFCSFSFESFPEGDRPLLESTGPWIADIIQKKRSEEKVLRYNRELQDVNTTLNVLLQNMEKEQDKKASALREEFRDCTMPLIDSLERITEGDRAKQLLSVLRANIDKIIAGSAGEGRVKLHALTAREREILYLLREGNTSKDIAKILGISVHSVFFHRKNIRRKLGIKGEGANLVSYITEKIN